MSSAPARIRSIVQYEKLLVKALSTSAQTFKNLLFCAIKKIHIQTLHN